MNKERLTAVVTVLKKRFNNLGAEELIKLAFQILEALDKVEEGDRL